MLLMYEQYHTSIVMCLHFLPSISLSECDEINKRQKMRMFMGIQV